MEIDMRARTIQSMEYIGSLEFTLDKFELIRDMLVSYLRIAQLQREKLESDADEICLLRGRIERAENRGQILRDVPRLSGGRRE